LAKGRVSIGGSLTKTSVRNPASADKLLAIGGSTSHGIKKERAG
jgi:hypothetical protein